MRDEYGPAFLAEARLGMAITDPRSHAIVSGVTESYVSPFPCFDPRRVDFWVPDNWPGGLGPAQWEVKPAGATLGFYGAAWLWVPGSLSPDGGEDLWSSSSHPITYRQDSARATRSAIKLARELVERRDMMLAALAEGKDLDVLLEELER